MTNGDWVKCFARQNFINLDHRHINIYKKETHNTFVLGPLRWVSSKLKVKRYYWTVFCIYYVDITVVAFIVCLF